MSASSQPEIPGELWMLWIPSLGEWTLASDDAPDGPTYLVAFTRAEAEAAAEYQTEEYSLCCHPVRVK